MTLLKFQENPAVHLCSKLKVKTANVFSSQFRQGCFSSAQHYMHQFHIPVLGLGYSIDTPLKVARYGISSVVSIVDDELTERMREYHCRQHNLPFHTIAKHKPGSRAKRIKAYLNLLNFLVDEQFKQLQSQDFHAESDLDRYFDLLPGNHPLKLNYRLLKQLDAGEREALEDALRNELRPGAIDVNIMAKIDKMNFDTNGQYTGDTETDALAALRGFAESDLSSSVVLSAGLNQRLYGYLENFADFYPDSEGVTKKKIILKVSDYRSAYVQARLLAKKGLWVNEYRVESGLNCGGHAFATDGLLMGPILEEFKNKRNDLQTELSGIYHTALKTKNIIINHTPNFRISAQGGIGTADEQHFLCSYYKLDATGWGSPFLLVPEATNVDEQTLSELTKATAGDFYLSNASPMGVPFNNFRNSSMELQRLKKIAEGRPGNPCTKKFLVNNTEFTNEPICTASRQYQAIKIRQLQLANLPDDELTKQVNAVTEKICLCDGLCASVYIKNNLLKSRETSAVAICPGPNIAYFSGTYTLEEMTGHIYGRHNLLQDVERPHVFINELKIYIDYLKMLIKNSEGTTDEKKQRYIGKFKAQLMDGIGYYRTIAPQLNLNDGFMDALIYAESEITQCGL